MATEDCAPPPAYETIDIYPQNATAEPKPETSESQIELTEPKPETAEPQTNDKADTGSTKSSDGPWYQTLGLVVFGIFAVLLCLALALALPIAEIVIGSRDLIGCPAERFITIYLVVSGSFWLTLGGWTTGSEVSSKKEDKKLANRCMNGLIFVFLFCWLICGSVWIYRMTPCTEEHLTSNTLNKCFTTNKVSIFYSKEANNYCNKTIYDFTYWEIIGKWIIIGILIIVGVIACFVIIVKDDKEDENPDENPVTVLNVTSIDSA